jgi:dTDP-glucose pyrophosphorylase
LKNHQEFLISSKSTTGEAIKRLNALAPNSILFIVDENRKLIGSLTDGDIRRGLINNLNINLNILKFANNSPKYLRKNKLKIDEIIKLRKEQFYILPIVNCEMKIVEVLNLKIFKSYIPADVLIMAGGKGERLRPLTDKVPKPLIKIDNVPILEHVIKRLEMFGINNINISVNYLADQIKDFFNKGRFNHLKISFVEEDSPLGTAGSLSKLKNISNDKIILMNSDLLTNINYEDLCVFFENKNADLVVVTIPYEVKIPYAILDIKSEKIISLKEKPSYTYFSNGGIYMIKRDVLKYIPKDQKFDATELIELLIQKRRNVFSYTLYDYWIDIGNKNDLEKARQQFNKIKLD